jgi:hypothetical protein
VHPWEISTTGDACDYFYHPWHANAGYAAVQHYNKSKPSNKQPKWNFERCILDQFQDQVIMNKRWNKPQAFKVPLKMGNKKGITKRNIKFTEVARIRTFVHRWNEEEGGGHDNAGLE